MFKDKIFEMIKANLLDVLPELDDETITMEHSLKELGANSIDRAEIILETLEEIQMNISMIKFGEAKNIGEIIGIILQERKDV